MSIDAILRKAERDTRDPALWNPASLLAEVERWEAEAGYGGSGYETMSGVAWTRDLMLRLADVVREQP